MIDTSTLNLQIKPKILYSSPTGSRLSVVSL